ncbi:MAG: FecR family protein [Dictyoglomus sp.]
MSKKFITFVLVFLIFLFSLAFSQDSPKPRVAIITYIKGNVYVKKLTSELWLPAKVKMELTSGDKVWVQQNSQAILQFSDKSTLKLGSNTQLDILNLDYEKDTKKEISIFKLLIGKIWATVERLLSQGERIEIQTPTAVAGVRGTEWIQEVSEDGTTKIWTLRGIVFLTAKDKTIEVKEGFQSVVKPDEPPSEPSEIKEIERFDEEEKKEEKKETTPESEKV